jgi:hypothetical protein
MEIFGIIMIELLFMVIYGTMAVGCTLCMKDAAKVGTEFPKEIIISLTFFWLVGTIAMLFGEHERSHKIFSVVFLSMGLTFMWYAMPIWRFMTEAIRSNLIF